MKFFNSISVAKSPQLLKSLLLSSAVATVTFLVLPIASALAAPIACGSIYGSYNNGSTFNSLRTYDPSMANLSAEIAALTDGTTGTTQPAIAALAVDPILDTNGRRRIYYTENITGTTRLFYYDGVNVFNTNITLSLPSTTVSIVQSTGTTATNNNSFNRMGFAPDGTLYIADAQKTFYRFRPDRSAKGGFLSTSVTISDNPNNDAGNSSRAQIGNSSGGDITFDNQGRMYIVTYDASGNIPTEFRLFQILNPSGNAPVAVLLGKAPTIDPVAGLAFQASDNKLYLQGSGGKSFSWDLGTNAVTNLGIITPGSADLGSCTYPNLDPLNTFTKTVTKITNVGATALTANDILEYTISIANTGNLAVGNATLVDLIPSGSTYVAGSTKLNNTLVPDVAGAMPYSNTTTPALVNSPGQASGVLLTGATNQAIVVFRVKVTTADTKICNQGTFRSEGGPTIGIPSDDPSTTSQAGDPTCIGSIASTPPVSLTCGLIYGSYNGGVFNSLRTYTPGSTAPSTQLVALTDGTTGITQPQIAAIGIDPILDTNGRRRVYYTENIVGLTRLFYHDGVSAVNTQITLTPSPTSNSIVRSDGTTATGGNSFNRMAFAPDGTLYIADGQKTFYRFSPNRAGIGGSLSSAVVISDNPNNDVSNSGRAKIGNSAGGDIAFDNQGRMYIVTYDANASNVPTEFRLFQILNPASSAPQAVLLGRKASTDPVAGLSFEAGSNQLYLQGSGGKSFSWDLSNNTVVTLATATPGSADLGSCTYPNFNPIGATTKTVTNKTNPTATGLTANDILEYTISVSNTGSLVAGNATLVDSIPSGTTYVAGSTKLNGVAKADVSGTMPYANSTTPVQINSPGQASGVLLSGAGNNAVVVFQVKVSATNTKVCNQATFKYDGGVVNGILTDDPTTTLVGDSTCIGRVATNANISLLKRIVGINGQTVNDGIDLTQFDNSNANWPTNYIQGAVDGGKVKPGDTIEYAIYFLNDGEINAKNVRICDRITPNQTYQSNSYGGTDLGMKLQLGTTTNPIVTLTSINDPTIDRSQFIPALGAVPSDCNLPGANDNGTTVLDLTGSTGSPTITTLPYNSYGVWRFTTKVNLSP